MFSYFMHVLHNHSLFPTLHLFERYFVTVVLDNLKLSARVTLCLYHNWSQQLQIYKYTLETKEWILEIKFSIDLIMFILNKSFFSVVVARNFLVCCIFRLCKLFLCTFFLCSSLLLCVFRCLVNLSRLHLLLLFATYVRTVRICVVTGMSALTRLCYC